MEIACIWEHNGNDTLLYARDFPGAYARGKCKEAAIEKVRKEIASYLRWTEEAAPKEITVTIVQEKESDLKICDADSDVLFDEERVPLSAEEYEALKALALKSAADFHTLYEAIPGKDKSVLPPRETFYGKVPRTAQEMYDHTKNVNAYYFGEIGVDADNEGTILECRIRGFEALERTPDFQSNPVFDGSYGELWSLRKVLRRFLWHDRIHAKAMLRMAKKTFPGGSIPNPFNFDIEA